MAMGIPDKLKDRVKTTKLDIDRKILTLTSESVKAIKTKVQKHTDIDVNSVEFNSQLARDVALKVLEKAQDIRKNLSKEELIKASVKTQQKVVNKAKDKIRQVTKR